MATRVIRYRAIAHALLERIEAGEWAPGQVLASEASLSSEFSASRVTIRKALEVLREEGLVESRQGFGWSVAADPLQQSLGSLGTIEAQLAASDRSSEREVTGFAFVEAPLAVRRLLKAATVLEVTRINVADGLPFAHVTVWCPESLGAGLSRASVEAQSFYDLLDVELGGATQTIAARAATKVEADALNVQVGSPVLACQRVTTDSGGNVILVSHHVFPGHVTEFVVDLPTPEAADTPTGLRLVDEHQR